MKGANILQCYFELCQELSPLIEQTIVTLSTARCMSISTVLYTETFTDKESKQGAGDTFLVKYMLFE